MQVLPYYIGIGKFFSSEEKDLFQPAKGLDKNKTVPATGVINGLKTRSEIRPGIIKDIIRIPIYQGDYNAEGTIPVLHAGALPHWELAKKYDIIDFDKIFFYRKIN